MLKSAFFAAVAAALLVACSTTATAPAQGYRPAGSTGAPWLITADLNELSNTVIIKINGEKAAEGAISMLTGAGEFSGGYQGKAVHASCSQSAGLVTYYSYGLIPEKRQCLVFIDNERAATLQF